ncbi:hypothetical protein Psuf_057180 [Phytohabitans suffuscus]|uniref:Uncharacterized protein n=1 Tax=Phytohabitans suffuscus TaxID=624315 RepID=A0A6F8YQE1_9ACTN|nr:hypothetical protein Psuf_057180 [Phytohabitans suffuscus]
MVQQVELARRQVQRRPAQRRLPRARVDPQLADEHRGLAGVAGAAAQHRAHPGVELGRRERLDHVVVGARVEAADDLGLVVAGGGDDDGHRADAAQHPQQLQAVEVGQAEVEHHEVGPLLERGLQPVHRGVRGGHRVPAFAQRPDQRGADGEVVLDEQQAGHTTQPIPPRHARGPALTLP